MRRLVYTLALLTVFVCTVYAREKGEIYAVGFYNLENMFDTCHDVGKDDTAFLPNGSYKWNTEKYTHKLRNMARVLAEMGTDTVSSETGCALIGVSEVENSRVLDDLVAQAPLAQRGYKYCHVEGPDQRGIDCALLYNPQVFSVRDVKLVPYSQAMVNDTSFFTRGFLTISGTLAQEHVTVVVCHLPSRFSTSIFREQGARQIRALKDSLLIDDPQVKVIVMGDMNDDPMDASMSVALGAKRDMKKVTDDDMFNPWWNTLANGNGTLVYHGEWFLFDQIILSPSLLPVGGKRKGLKYYANQIFCREYMMQHEGKYNGTPLRTHGGRKWLDGYSDHLPTVVYLIKL